MEEPRTGGGKVQPWKRLLSEIGPESDALDICIVSDRPWVRLQLAEEARINMAGPRLLRYPEYEAYRRPDPFPQIYKAEKGGLFAAPTGDYVRVTSEIKACQGATVEGFRVKAEEVERQARGKGGAIQSFEEVTAAAQQHVAKAEAVEVERRHGLLAWLSLAKMVFSIT
ncbi:hypothetical protein PG984_011433 [Apiospora sp. TS-2023a]